MSTIEITSMSTKGQIVIPASMRKQLNIGGGSKMIVLQDGNNILLKPIQKPKKDEFKSILHLADELRTEIDLTEGDIEEAIKATRKALANRS